MKGTLKPDEATRRSAATTRSTISYSVMAMADAYPIYPAFDLHSLFYPDTSTPQPSSRFPYISLTR
jgi:hypothetical protein